jgi:lysophospholipase L1-like esterase
MTDRNKNQSEHTLRRIILFLSVLILINPVILYLVTDSILLCLLIPFLLLSVILILNESVKFKPLKVLLFNLILVASFFLHAEAIFTFNFSDYIIDDLYVVNQKYFFNRPYLNKNFRDKEFNVQYKTNKQGFRIGEEDDPEIGVEKADWLFLGDSYTQGAQVQYEDLYTSKLFEFFPDKVIVNAGISGFGLPEEYNYFINEGKKLKPQKVFLQICNFNDFMNVKEKQSGFSDYLMHYSNFARFVLYGFKYTNPAELPLGRWTEPFYPDVKSNEDYNIFYKQSSNIKKQDIKNFKMFLKKINAAVKKIGAELIVVQIPTKEQVYYKYFDEVLSNFKIDVAKLDMDFPNKLLDSLCKESNIAHIDLLSDFTDSEYNLFYQFDEHLNILGHQQMAKSISKFLNKTERKTDKPTMLSSFNTGDRYPNFSLTNCNLLSFQSYREGNMELFISDSLMKNVKRLTWNTVDEIHQWLSPDNNKIIFTEGNQKENKTKVVLMNIDGSERRYITNDEYTFGAIPSFSYDGSKIAYAEWKQDDKSGNLSNSYIVVYNLSTSEKRIITIDSVESWRPIFSPDNEKLYFISKERRNQFDVFEYDLTKGVLKNITNSSFDEWDPAISKDGKLLVYSANKDGNWDLFLYVFKTGNMIQLTKSIGNEWDPTFAPCGQYLYYSGTFGLRNGIFRLKLK